MIQLRNIHKSYVMGENRLHVLKGIDLDVEAGRAGLDHGRLRAPASRP